MRRRAEHVDKATTEELFAFTNEDAIAHHDGARGARLEARAGAIFVGDGIDDGTADFARAADDDHVMTLEGMAVREESSKDPEENQRQGEEPESAARFTDDLRQPNSDEDAERAKRRRSAVWGLGRSPIGRSAHIASPVRESVRPQ